MDEDESESDEVTSDSDVIQLESEDSGGQSEMQSPERKVTSKMMIRIVREFGESADEVQRKKVFAAWIEEVERLKNSPRWDEYIMQAYLLTKNF